MNEEERIRDLVRRVVYRTVGRAVPETRVSSKTLVTQQDVELIPEGGEFQVPENALVTPLARQAAIERKVRLVTPDDLDIDAAAAERTVALGADHGGVQLKDRLLEHVGSLGFKVVDCGTDGPESVDYPDIALAVARLVAGGRVWRGILVDGAGIGSCMAANKVPGVRAALCYDEATAVNSREHNHANVLTLGAGLIGADLATKIVTTWLETPAGGGRHQRRVDKITDIEQRYARRGGGSL